MEEKEESVVLKWVVLGLIGLGVVAYGYRAHINQKNRAMQASRGPIGVAAVRGSEGAEVSMKDVSNVAVDYAESLQDNKSMAEKNAAKYNEATKNRQQDIENMVNNGQ